MTETTSDSREYVQLFARVDSHLYEKIRAASYQRRCSGAAVLREALDAWLERESLEVKKKDDRDFSLMMTRIGADQHRRLRELSEQRGEPIAELVREAMQFYVNDIMKVDEGDLLKYRAANRVAKQRA